MDKVFLGVLLLLLLLLLSFPLEGAAEGVSGRWEQPLIAIADTRVNAKDTFHFF